MPLGCTDQRPEQFVANRQNNKSLHCQWITYDDEVAGVASKWIHVADKSNNQQVDIRPILLEIVLQDKHRVLYLHSYDAAVFSVIRLVFNAVSFNTIVYMAFV